MIGRAVGQSIPQPSAQANAFEDLKTSFANNKSVEKPKGGSEKYLTPQKRLRFDGVMMPSREAVEKPGEREKRIEVITKKPT